MQRLLIVAVSLSLSLGGLSGSVLAQSNNGLVVIDDASGSNGSSGPCARRDRSRCGDQRPDDGIADLVPPTDTAPVAPEPAPPAAAPDTGSAPPPSDAAVATATDQDADNAPDELEPGMGLDPTNPDTDADHVADGDEINIYGTDPLNPDTDGDGVSDGEELFATYTDPLA